jgi:hypothetical protein
MRQKVPFFSWIPLVSTSKGSIRPSSSHAKSISGAIEGVQAQTMSVYHTATAKGLKIVPVLNKVMNSIYMSPSVDER